MRKYAVLSLIFLWSALSFGQNITARITINYGGSLYFHFNALTKYQNGIAYTDYSEFIINYTDTTDAGLPAYSDWQFTVKPLSAITGDATGNTLAYSEIHIRTKLDGAIVSDVPLSVGETVIASGTLGSEQEQHIITISYSCGETAPGLMGETPDYYFVDLEYTLEPKP